jgi:hypothetical protein
LSDKDFKVKNKLVVNGLTGGAGPLIANSNKEIDSVSFLTTLQGGTGTTTSPGAGQVLYSAGGTSYNPTAINTLDVKGATYSADAPSSPVIGQIWVESDTTSDSFDPNIIRRKSFTATAAQTTFTTDVPFIQGYEQVFFNGMLLVRNNDYTTTNDTTVVLTTGAAVNDVVEVVTITNLNSINTATTTTNTFTGNQIVNANIGIGTSPGQKLDIANDGAVHIRQTRYSTDATPTYHYIRKSRGTSATPTVVSSGDAVGGLYFEAYDGLNFTNLAQIITSVDGTPGVGDMPGRITFWTTADGASSVSERMRIMSNGKVTIGTSSIFTTTTPTTAKLTVISDSNLNDTNTNSFISLRNKNNTNAITVVGGILSDTYRDIADPHYSAGMWFIREPFSGNASSSGEIAFGTGGNVSSLALPTERVRIDSEGNVGIGYSAPNAKLEIRSANAVVDGYGLVTIGSNNFGVDHGGSVSFAGVTSSDNNQSNFVPYAQIGGRKENSTSGNYAGYLSFATRIHTGALTERARINSTGYMLLGYTSSNGAFRLQVNSQIFATSASIATSDGRFKDNVDTISGGLNIIDSLRPVSFTWKDHPVHNFVAGKTVGFIAQEVREALSEYDWVDNIIKSNVNEETEEEFLGIAESNIIPLLVAAVKELKARVESLEAN